MKLSGGLIEAFYQIAQTKNFTRAASVLHITQSALSQRIRQLEDELGVTLIIRERTGAVMTAEGERLLRYCRVQKVMEDELLQDIRHSKGQGTKGVIRIGAFSSVLRSVVMPCLAPIISKSQDVGFEFASREMRDLFPALRTNEVDFIVSNEMIDKKDYLRVYLGDELLVLVESNNASFARSGTMLDHDFEDPTTDHFFTVNANKVDKYQRCYLDEIYGIIDGVRQGFGRAVVSRHLIEGIKGIRQVGGYKPLKAPVYLYYHAMPYYTRLQTQVIEALNDGVKKYL